MPVATGPAVPVWFMVAGAKAVKLLWQVSHCDVVGICVLGLPKAVEPLWQVEQRPAAGGFAAAWLNVAVAQLTVELWQVSHCELVGRWVAGLACAFCAR